VEALGSTSFGPSDLICDFSSNLINFIDKVDVLISTWILLAPEFFRDGSCTVSDAIHGWGASCLIYDASLLIFEDVRILVYRVQSSLTHPKVDIQHSIPLVSFSLGSYMKGKAALMEI